MEKGYTICIVLMALFMGVQSATTIKQNLNSIVGKATEASNILQSQSLNIFLRPLQDLITKLVNLVSSIVGGGGARGKPGTAIATSGVIAYGSYDDNNVQASIGSNGMNANGEDGKPGASSIFWPFGRSGADGKPGGIASSYGFGNNIFGSSNNRKGKNVVIGGRDYSGGNPSMFMDQNGNGYGASYQNGNGYGGSYQNGNGYGGSYLNGNGYGGSYQNGNGYGGSYLNGNGYGDNLYESSLKDMDENGNIVGGKNNVASSDKDNNNNGLFGSGGLLSKLLPRGGKGEDGKPGYTGVGNGNRVYL